jgi:secreted PhoX family phosphatase
LRFPWFGRPIAAVASGRKGCNIRPLGFSLPLRRDTVPAAFPVPVFLNRPIEERFMHQHEEEQVCNPSGNDYFGNILEINLARRQVLKGGLGAAALAFLGFPALAPAPSAHAAPLPPRSDFGGIGFDGIAPNTLANGLVDDVRLPPGYRYEVLFAWGDPIGIVGLPPGQPEFKWDASNSAEEQALQSGAHHDGMWFFPFPGPRGRSRGLLCVNHEYVDQGLLFPDGTANWSLEKIRKSQNAHGVSVVEVWKDPRTGRWALKRPSPFARRLTGNSPMRISGPAAGHPLLQTAADPAGGTVLGTLNNCASGFTPWGTYLTCEENWNGYFGSATPGFNDARTDDQRRYGLSASGFGFRWHEFDERFEYIYKFVSKGRFNPRHRAANMDLLDEGTLYVARFNADGTGDWL